MSTKMPATLAVSPFETCGESEQVAQCIAVCRSVKPWYMMRISIGIAQARSRRQETRIHIPCDIFIPTLQHRTMSSLHGPHLATPDIVAKETQSGDANCAEARTPRSLSRLTTHISSMTLLFCAGLGFQCGQNFAGSGLCALFCHLEPHGSRSDQHDRPIPRRFSSQSCLTGPANSPLGEGLLPCLCTGTRERSRQSQGTPLEHPQQKRRQVTSQDGWGEVEHAAFLTGASSVASRTTMVCGHASSRLCCAGAVNHRSFGTTFGTSGSLR